MLAVDAFSSDSIPVHLLTREAFALYFQHLKPGGVLCVHVSNRYLDLQPVVAGLANALHKEARLVEDTEDESADISASQWILVTAGGVCGQTACEGYLARAFQPAPAALD